MTGPDDEKTLRDKAKVESSDKQQERQEEIAKPEEAPEPKTPQQINAELKLVDEKIAVERSMLNETQRELGLPLTDTSVAIENHPRKRDGILATQRQEQTKPERIPFKEQPFAEHNDTLFSMDPSAVFNPEDYYKSEVAGNSTGWKIHIPYESLSRFQREALNDLLKKNSFNWYERGHENEQPVWHQDFPSSKALYKIDGSDKDQPGKGMTVYAGSKNNLDALARDISKLGILSPQTKGVKFDDVNVIGNVWARFDTRHPDFDQYGKWGISIKSRLSKTKVWQDMMKRAQKGERLFQSQEELDKIQSFILDSIDTLAETYGEYFMGKKLEQQSN